MTLFLGGSRHGTDMDVERIPGDVAQLLPPFYVDILTAERYVLTPVSLTLVNQITNLAVAVLECTVYMVEGLTDPQQVGTALGDAVTRWWFQTHGIRKDIADAASNGRSAGATFPFGRLRPVRRDGCAVRQSG